MIVTIPPEQADLDSFFCLEGLSNLNPLMVRQHAPDLLLMSLDQGHLLARASLWWSHVPDHSKDRLGLVGHYAAKDDDSAATILAESCRILSKQGCSLAVGPMDGSTWRRYRLLSHRGEEPSFFLEPDNPDDWPPHFESAGFHAFARYYSSINKDNSSCKDRSALRMCLEHDGYRLRPLAVGELEAELDYLWQLSSEGFKDNFLYTPISKDEFLEMYKPLLPHINPELVLIMEWQDMPVAFCLALPDMLQAQRGQPVDTVIIKSFAVQRAHRGKGLASVMTGQINRTARLLGMHRTIHALMHQDNPSRQIDRSVMRDFRCYTLYARRL